MPGLLLISSLNSFGSFISGGTPADGGGVKLEGCEGFAGGGGGATLELEGGGAAGVDEELPISKCPVQFFFCPLYS